MFKKKKSTPRLCVIGLDGTPHSLLLELTQNGTMPNLAKILDEGRLYRMKVSLPEISSVSWASFMTGSNPGQHGIFGFTDLKPNSYQLTFPTYHQLRVPPFWDRLGAMKKRSIIINQPGTYPVKPLSGVLVAGFVVPNFKKAVYPEHYYDTLMAQGYEVDIDTMKARQDHEYLIRALHDTLKKRQTAADYFWNNENWDYFQLVVTGTDRLQHYLWDALEEGTHSYHQRFLDYYHAVDQLIGDFYQKFTHLNPAGSSDGFFLLSDHGFCRIKREVYLNAWLRQAGYLRLKSPKAEMLDDIAPESQAFAMDPGRIYIHEKGRYPAGSVEANKVRPLAEELRQKLLALEFEGQAVFEQIWHRDEIYQGPCLSEAPHLIAVPQRGFDLKGSLRQKELFFKGDLSGMHTWDDAFFYGHETLSEELYISQLAEIFLRRLLPNG
jgi:predicted AlkP superfamily phosphohydrolase/phosphomutase